MNFINSVHTASNAYFLIHLQITGTSVYEFSIQKYDAPNTLASQCPIPEILFFPWIQTHMTILLSWLLQVTATSLSISQIADIPIFALKPLTFYLTIFVHQFLQYIYPFEKLCLPLPSHILPSCLKIKTPWFMKINRIFCFFTSWILPEKIQIWLSPTLFVP